MSKPVLIIVPSKKSHFFSPHTCI